MCVCVGGGVERFSPVSVEKVLFKADFFFFFFFFFCMTEMRRQTLAHNLNIQCIIYAHAHNATV